MGEIKAQLRLADGRKIWRDGRGRYREVETGRYVRGEVVEQQGATKTPDVGGEAIGRDGAKFEGARQRAKHHLLAAVRALGLPAEGAEDAWGRLVGGTTLEEGSGLQRVPLLHSIFESGSWETQNIVETLLTSEVIAYAAARRLKIEGPTDNVEVEYGEPGRLAYVPPGHALNPMATPGTDQGLAVVAQRVAERIGKSTVPTAFPAPPAASPPAGRRCWVEE